MTMRVFTCRKITQLNKKEKSTDATLFMYYNVPRELILNISDRIE